MSRHVPPILSRAVTEAPRLHRRLAVSAHFSSPSPLLPHSHTLPIIAQVPAPGSIPRSVRKPPAWPSCLQAPAVLSWAPRQTKSRKTQAGHRGHRPRPGPSYRRSSGAVRLCQTGVGGCPELIQIHLLNPTRPARPRKRS